MLDANVKSQIKGYMANLTHNIEITASIDDSDKSRELESLLKDIQEQSDKIALKFDNEANVRKPSFKVTRVGEDMGITFAGLPMGHEFTSLVLALLQAGGYPPKTSPEVLEQIRNLPGEFVFETYISLSCQNCPDVVQALNLMAVMNPNIRHTMIDGALFQDEVNQRQVIVITSYSIHYTKLYEIYMLDNSFLSGLMFCYLKNIDVIIFLYLLSTQQTYTTLCNSSD